MVRLSLRAALLAAAALLLASTPASAADEQRVKKSVAAAIDFLKQVYPPGGNHNNDANAGGGGGPGAGAMAIGGGGDGGGGHGEGAAALGGIALLEAGVPASDPVIQGIARSVRAGAVSQDQVYSVSLDIIFLDKLGEKIDHLLIQSLGARLVLSQTSRGGWGYKTYKLDANEQQRLRDAVGGAVLKGSADLPQIGADIDSRPGLDAGVAEYFQGRRLVAPENLGAVMGDNSNTQFAVIGLWTARRHGINVQKAMELVSERFRRTQQPSGGWGYVFNDLREISPSMTCAGLLALAIVSGHKSERSMRSRGQLGADGKLVIDPAKNPPKAGPNPLNDPAVQRGLRFLEAVVNSTGKAGAKPPNNGAMGPGQFGPMGPMGPGQFGPMGPMGPGQFGPMGPMGPGQFGPMRPGGPGVPPPPGVGPMGGFPMPQGPGGLPGGGPGGGGAMGPLPPGDMPSDPRHNFYFMWSLERVCMVFNLNTLAGKDWHAWGAEYLLEAQSLNGSWRGKYGEAVDTSFALMFMCRSNIVKDLSRLMKGGGVGDFKPADPMAGGPKKPDPTKPAPGNTGDAETSALTKALVESMGAVQSQLLKEYTAQPGSKYSRALADAIPKLKGDAQSKARDGLAERMSRQKVTVLEGYLDDENPEIRRAAALGAAMRDEKELVPILIDSLEDESEIVWRAARLALRELTTKDFGPKPGDNEAKRTKAVADWRAWQKAQK